MLKDHFTDERTLKHLDCHAGCMPSEQAHDSTPAAAGTKLNQPEEQQDHQHVGPGSHRMHAGRPASTASLEQVSSSTSSALCLSLQTQLSSAQRSSHCALKILNSCML